MTLERERKNLSFVQHLFIGNLFIYFFIFSWYHLQIFSLFISTFLNFQISQLKSILRFLVIVYAQFLRKGSKVFLNISKDSIAFDFDNVQCPSVILYLSRLVYVYLGNNNTNQPSIPYHILVLFTLLCLIYFTTSWCFKLIFLSQFIENQYQTCTDHGGKSNVHKLEQ